MKDLGKLARETIKEANLSIDELVDIINQMPILKKQLSFRTYLNSEKEFIRDDLEEITLKFIDINDYMMKITLEHMKSTIKSLTKEMNSKDELDKLFNDINF